MAQLLRTTLDPEVWWREKAEPWLANNTVPGDCVSDLRTAKNTLSVYEVANDAETRRVVAVLALQRAKGLAKQKVSLRDMAGMVFDDRVLESIGIRRCKVKGGTLDAAVNELHFDLVELSGHALVALTRELILAGAPRTFFVPDLLAELKSCRDAGYLPADAFPERVEEQIKNM